METDHPLREKRQANPARAVLETGLYHSFTLPNGSMAAGAMSIEWQEQRLASFHLPNDLRGKRVLDIGPWDGYYTFEMERRGAEVMAIDYVDLDSFRALHRAFKSNAVYRRMDIYELDVVEVGAFDIVLCLGVLYHLKHPLLALEKICAVTREVCIIDTFVIDGEELQRGIQPPLPYAEFYERAELGGQLDNWCGPTVSAVEAWIRAAGFARAEVVGVTNTTACILAYRQWGTLPLDKDPAIHILGLNSHLNRGRSFRSKKEEYIQLWCAWPGTTEPAIDTVFTEVDGFGVAPLACSLTPHGLLVSLRTPPGLAPGRHEARVKIGNASWSATSEFHMDLPDVEVKLTICAIQDGVTWQTGEVDWSEGGWMTIWIDGLSPEADAGNTTVLIEDIPHQPDIVLAEKGQVNVRLRPLIAPGSREVIVVHRGSRSCPATVRVVGSPPDIRGLEGLAGHRD